MFKRKHSFKRGKRASKRHKSSPFGYGPVGGVRPGRRGTTQSIVRNPRINPDRVFVKLERSFVGTLVTGAAGVFATQYVKCNSANDPLGTLGTGQPTGANQWLGTNPAQYQSYIVHAFRVKVTLTSNNYNMLAALSFQASATLPGSCAQAASSSYGSMAIIAPNAYPTRLGRYLTTGQVYGQSPQTVAIADSFSAAYSSDPTSMIYGVISCQDILLTTQYTAAMTVTVTQWVECFQRVTPT